MIRFLKKSILLAGSASLALGAVWLFIGYGSSLAKAVENERTLSLSQFQRRPQAQNEIEITVDEVVASGFTRPVQVTHAGDGSGRLFVVEQDGLIKIIDNGTVLSPPFLNIKSLVRSPDDGGHNEEGLLSVAFPPDYANKGHFYVFYTNTSSNLVIARYSLLDPNSADASSEEIVLTIPHPASGQPAQGNHNGGQLAFGPNDGYLYLGAGDGGGGGDPNNNAQNGNLLLGKILRIDVETNDPLTYTIPAANPFTQTPGVRDEIWALGLRNPWRFSFDRQNGDLYIGDVGQGNWEEISYQAANTPGGLNFGWRCREGAHNFNFSGNCGDLTLIDPIAEYDHTQGLAVSGGFVYRGTLYPALRGYYFFADYGSGKIWSMRQTGATTWSIPEEELDMDFLISSFGEDENGELYVVEFSFGNTGKIRRLADAHGPAHNLWPSTKTAAPPFADPGQEITYTIRLENMTGPVTNTFFLSDIVPPGLIYVTGTLTTTFGTIDDAQAPALAWQGALSPTPKVTITYRVKATGDVTGMLTNQAVVTGATIEPLTLTETVLVPRPQFIYLPIALK